MSKTIPTGERAVIIGNGPSVDLITPAAWRSAQDAGWLLVGTNRALVFEALQGVTLDAICIHDTPADLWKAPFVCCEYHQHFWKPSPAWKVGPAAQRIAVCDEYAVIVNHWVNDCKPDHNRERSVRGGSVTAMSINWAWQQGCKTIALIGVDYTGGGYARMQDMYSVPTAGATYTDKEVEPCIERQFEDCRVGMESSGGRLVNLSPNSLLKAVPLATWESVVK